MSFSQRQLIILIISLSLSLLLSIIATIYFGKQKKIINSLGPTAQEIELVELPESNQLQDLKQLNILLLGFGGAGHAGGFLTDVIQLLHLDFVTNQIYLISIPRDLWVTLPSGKQAKINQSFTLGENPDQPIESGGQVAKTMIKVVTGLEPQYFIAIDFVGFQRLIDEELNGLEVDVPEILDDPWYPIKGEEQNICDYTPEEVTELSANYSGFELEKQFACRYEHLHFEIGPQVMQGHEALAYVRSRHGSGSGDFSRSQRQHALLKALKNKLISMDALSQTSEIYQQLQHTLTTDIDLTAIKYAPQLIKPLINQEINTIILSTDNVFTTSKSADGQFILVPKQGSDWQSVHEYLAKLLLQS